LVKNNILVLLSDQDARGKGVLSKFFEIDSSTHSGAAILSKRNNSPIIYASITKKDEFYEIEFIKIDTSGSINDIVQQYTAEIEKTIIKNPEQYFWFHKRWKSVRKYQ
jgi:KDO2-lipid IV(A) lauroyltransferase